MRTTLLTLLLLAVPAVAGQTVWKWVDEKGVTHYSDTPRPGATQMELNSVNRSDSSSSSAPRTSTPPTQSAPSAPGARRQEYTTFQIVEPAQGETVANTGGFVEVNLELAGGLQPGHSIVVYLDGKPVEKFPPDGLNYNLTEVPRGAHSLQATIVDGSGTRVETTQPIQFYVRQESSAQPPVGPAMRPPPKPRPSGAANKLPTTQPAYSALNGGDRPKIDPRTNLPVNAKPPTASGPKSGN